MGYVISKEVSEQDNNLEQKQPWGLYREYIPPNAIVVFY
jgi:hypothetical protein